MIMSRKMSNIGPGFRGFCCAFYNTDSYRHQDSIGYWFLDLSAYQKILL